MHQRERWQAILTTVRDRTLVTVAELVDLTGASAATLRRDLSELEEQGHVRRVHGGVERVADDPAAVSRERPVLATRSFDVSQTLNVERKRAIAKAAADLCHDHQSIIINAGTTTYQMVDFIAERPLSVLTNSFPIAQALMARGQTRVSVPGGELYREQGIILSPFDNDLTQNWTASIMFMSAVTISPMGVIEGDPLIARAEAKLLSQAEQLVVLIDSTKFEARGSLVVCPLSQVSRVITDDGAPAAMLDMLRAAGITVVVVPVAANAVALSQSGGRASSAA